MRCECGKTIYRTNVKNIYQCIECERLWRLEYEDIISGTCRFVDYNTELEDKNQETIKHFP